MRPTGKALTQLLKKYERGDATAEEKAFVEAFYAQFETRPSVTGSMSEEELDATRTRLLQKIDLQIADGELAPVIPMRIRIFPQGGLSYAPVGQGLL